MPDDAVIIERNYYRAVARDMQQQLDAERLKRFDASGVLALAGTMTRPLTDEQAQELGEILTRASK